MKLRNLFYSALCALAVTAAFTSCSDDDDDNDSWREGSKVELPQYRAFILSEGTMNRNDSHLSFFDPTSSSPVTMDIYETQNGRKLGDTANDMIERNRYMVDRAKSLIAVYDGKGSGGTAATVQYAMSKDVKIIVINPDTLEVQR